jgi:hypothetical protein
MRGDLQDFAYGMSTLQVVEDLVACGVEVRRLPSLHAKAYIRELPDGSLAAWVGSANLTHKGRLDGKWNANIEVMAGPFTLHAADKERVEGLWRDALPFDSDHIRRYRAALMNGGIVDRGIEVLVVRIDLRLKPGAFLIPVDWFVDWRGWEGVATSVRYVTSNALMGDGWPAVRGAVLKGFAKWFGERTGSRGEFVVAAEDHPVVARALAAARALVDGASPRVSPDVLARAETDFVGRAMVVVDVQARSRSLRVHGDAVRTELRAAFARYAESQPSRMLYTILAPVSQLEGTYSEAIVRLKSRVRPLFARDIEGGADRFVDGIDKALAEAGLRG